jgi:Zn-dependent protease with chaperone function
MRVFPARVLAAALAVVVLAAPAGAQAAISQDYELAVGREVAATLIARYGIVADSGWMAFLTDLRDRLVPFSGRPALPYQIVILNAPEPNAASTPGYIFITRGMLGLNLDTEGWAFVLAHEIAHTSRRHVAAFIERAYAGALFSLLVAILTGSRAAADLVRLLLDLATLGFSRDKETEADLEALRMLVDAGFPPEAAPRTLAWFNQVTGRRQERTHWAGTHPGFLDRVEAVRSAYRTFPSRGLPLRVWHSFPPADVDGVVVRPHRLAELAEAWTLDLEVQNTTDSPATVMAGQLALLSADGELAIRFLQSTLPGDLGPAATISGRVVFDKRSSSPPRALRLALLFADRRVEAEVDLTSGGPYSPGPERRPLPTPPPPPGWAGALLPTPSRSSTSRTTASGRVSRLAGVTSTSRTSGRRRTSSRNGRRAVWITPSTGRAPSRAARTASANRGEHSSMRAISSTTTTSAVRTASSSAGTATDSMASTLTRYRPTACGDDRSTWASTARRPPVVTMANPRRCPPSRISSV